MIPEIPVKEYFNHGIRLKPREEILRRGFVEWLPDIIIDSHVHAGPKSAVMKIDDDIYSHPMSTFPWFDQNLHLAVVEQLYPGKQVSLLAMPMTYRGINFVVANNYLLEVSQQDKLIKPVLFGIPDHEEYTVTEIASGKYCALKMYFFYFRPPATTIGEVFPDRILEAANKKGIAIILHLPTPLQQCRIELEEKIQRYQNIKFVIAHMGITMLTPPDLAKDYACLAKYPNIFFDTAATPNLEAISLALNAFGHERVLFATDQPLNLLRVKAYLHPTFGERLVSDYPYHWVHQEEFKEFGYLAQDAIALHWEVLTAIKRSIEYYGESTEVIHCIFSQNAQRVFSL